MTPDSFEQTALPHMAVLQNYALRLTMDSDNAKDLLQETYLKAFRFWGSFEEGTNIKAWMCRIMKNSFINHYRKCKLEPVTVSYEPYHLPHNLTQELHSPRKPLPGKSCDELFEDEVIRSIESIGDMFRKVIVLADVEGFSYEEIAKTVGCPMGTVRSRLHRGRKLLRKRLFAYARQNRFIPKRTQGQSVLSCRQR
jgi:RNA polymerase sigma-70 factor (ECF subfamily)